MNDPHWSLLPAASRGRFRFTMVFLVTACAAALFALSNTLGAPWFAPVLCVLLLLLVWAAQWLFRSWQRPQIVATLAGGVFGAGLFVGLSLYDPVNSPRQFGPQGATLFAAGMLAGYFAGWIGSWIFWTDALLRDGFRAKRARRAKLRAAMSETPPESPWDD